MKRQLLFTFSVFALLSVSAQTIPNGGFENWNASSSQDPRYYPANSNAQNLQMGLPANVLQVADPQAGALAVQLNTVSNATDTSFGYILNGDPNTLAGGIPYNQHPITLTGYYKCNIPAGDTGIIFIVFKQAGTAVSIDVGQFYGVHNTYTAFTVTLTIPPLANPDTVLLGAASSNAFVWSGIPGSMLQLDNLSFTGVATQPTQLNGSFELWDQHTMYTPAQWSVGGDTIYRSTNAHSGSYSLRLGTISYGGPNIGFGVASNGTLSQSGPPMGGRPYTLMADTLTGWYQFSTPTNDSATIWINCTNNTNPVGGAYVGLPPAATWTYFSIPFMSGSAPDTLMVVAAGVFGTVDSTAYGNLLLLDDVQLKSSLLSTGPSWVQLGVVKVFPDPATTETFIEYNNSRNQNVKLTVMNDMGQVIYSEELNGTGEQRVKLDLTGFAKGSYLVTLEQDGGKVIRKLIVQ